jgi:hypothetical protein
LNAILQDDIMMVLSRGSACTLPGARQLISFRSIRAGIKKEIVEHAIASWTIAPQLISSQLLFPRGLDDGLCPAFTHANSQRGDRPCPVANKGIFGARQLLQGASSPWQGYA